MKQIKIPKIKIIEIPKISDPRGNLAVIEKEVLPFPIKRVYYLYEVPSDSFRGGHAHKAQKEFLIAISGSFDVVLNDGKQKQTVTLNKPNMGLLIGTSIWRELENFSSEAVCLVIASEEFDETDYIRDYEEFLLTIRT